jgi:DNA polymerase
VAVEDVTKEQRFVGKTTILGAGYGMGAVRFVDQLATFGFDMDLNEARRVISVYRDSNWKISQLWRQAQHVLKCMYYHDGATLGRQGVLTVAPEHSAIRLPSGLLLRYGDLQFEQEERGPQYNYHTRKGRNKIYGGKVVENVCQAIARCIIAEQMLKIPKQYKAVLTVHDSIVCCVPETEVSEAQLSIEKSMRWIPDWATGLPLDCESGIGNSYGECE